MFSRSSRSSSARKSKSPGPKNRSPESKSPISSSNAELTLPEGLSITSGFLSKRSKKAPRRPNALSLSLQHPPEALSLSLAASPSPLDAPLEPRQSAWSSSSKNMAAHLHDTFGGPALSLGHAVIGNPEIDFERFQDEVTRLVSHHITKVHQSGEKLLILADVEPTSLPALLQVLAELLCKFSVIQQLVIVPTSSVFQPAAIAALNELIRINDTLKSIDLSFCSLTLDGRHQLISGGLSMNWTLEDFILAPKRLSLPMQEILDISRHLKANKSAARCRENNSTSFAATHRQIHAVPPTLFESLKPIQLTKIDFSHNQFALIPPEIFAIKSLRYLIFSHNLLTELPPEISRLLLLEYLDLSGNRLLREISITLNTLSHLKQLSLLDTKVEHIPQSIAFLPNLTKLDIYGTPFLNKIEPYLQSKNMAMVNMSDIQKLQFYYNLSLPRLPSRMVKLTIIGSKTLASRVFTTFAKEMNLTKQKGPPKVINTSEITHWKIVGNRDWDLHLVVHWIHPETFTSWNLAQFQQQGGYAILVLDLSDRKHLNSAKFWCGQIKLYGSPNVYLIGTSSSPNWGTEASVREQLSALFTAVGPKLGKSLHLLTSIGAFEGDLGNAQSLRDRLIADAANLVSMAPSYWNQYLTEIIHSFVSQNFAVLEEREVLQRFAAYPPESQKILLGFWTQYQQLGILYFHRTLRVTFLSPTELDLVLSHLRQNPPAHMDGVIKGSVLASFLHTTFSHHLDRFPILIRLFIQLGFASVVSPPDAPDPEYFMPILLANVDSNPSDLISFWPQSIRDREEYSERSMVFTYLPKGFFDQILVKIMSFGFWILKSCWSHGIILDTSGLDNQISDQETDALSTQTSLLSLDAISDLKNNLPNRTLDDTFYRDLDGNIQSPSSPKTLDDRAPQTDPVATVFPTSEEPRDPLDFLLEASQESFEVTEPETSTSTSPSTSPLAPDSYPSSNFSPFSSSSPSSSSPSSSSSSSSYSSATKVSSRSRPEFLANFRNSFKIPPKGVSMPPPLEPSSSQSELDSILFQQHSSGGFAPLPKVMQKVRLFLDFDEAHSKLSVRLRGIGINQILLFILESLNTFVEDLLHTPSVITFSCAKCRNSAFNASEVLKANHQHIAHLKCPDCAHENPINLLAPDLALSASSFSIPEISFSDLTLPQLIASGSEGTKVFRALYIDRMVAVKRIGFGSNFQDAFRILAEVRREIWIMSTMQHPNILRIAGLSRDNYGRLLVVEELCDEDLQKYLLNSDHDISWQLRLKLAREVSLAMEFLHTRNPIICHRDLKSPNILIRLRSSGDRVAKVADFGMARMMGLTNSVVRGEADGLDNCLWQAPEVIKKAETDHTADIYAFGIILWELFTREIPFNQFTWMTEIADFILTGGRPQLPSDPFPEFIDLMKACWAEKRAQRPSFTMISKALSQMVPPSSLLPSKPVPITSTSNN